MLNKQLFKDEMVKLLSIHGIKIDKIPRTANGKIMRK